MPCHDPLVHYIGDDARRRSKQDQKKDKDDQKFALKLNAPKPKKRQKWQAYLQLYPNHVHTGLEERYTE